MASYRVRLHVKGIKIAIKRFFEKKMVRFSCSNDELWTPPFSSVTPSFRPNPISQLQAYNTNTCSLRQNVM